LIDHAPTSTTPQQRVEKKAVADGYFLPILIVFCSGAAALWRFTLLVHALVACARPST
jgi:hypothetical protein